MIPKQCRQIRFHWRNAEMGIGNFTPEKSSDKSICHSETNKMSHCKNTPKFLHFPLLKIK